MVHPVNRNRIGLVVVFIILEVSKCSSYLEAMRNACPFLDFCTVLSLRQYNTTGGDHSPCCTSCSCEADCWIWDNCCPDVVHEKPTDLQKANCISMYINKLPHSQVSVDEYRVMDFCPGDYGGKEIIDQCEGRFAGAIGLSDVVAVSDAKHRIYKNKYCALCNDVTEYVSWNLKMSGCPSNITLIGIDFLHTIMGSCTLQSVPPANTNSDLMLCELRDTCPNSSSSNPEIVQGCHEGPYAPYMWNDFFVQVYKNVLCKLCTTDNVTLDANGILCPSDWYDFSRGGAQGLSVLLDLTVSQKLVEAPTTSCSETEIFDYIQQKCRKRFCPSFSIASRETCVQIGTIMDSLLLIDILFTPTEQVYIHEDLKHHDVEESREYMLYFARIINLKSTRCGVRVFQISTIKDRNDQLLVVSVKLSVLINENCQFKDVASIVRKHLTGYIYIVLTINSAPVQLTGKIDFYIGKDGLGWKTFNYSQYVEETMAYWQPSEVKERYLYSDFFICPYLVLDIDQYNAVIGNAYGVGADNNLTEINRFTRLANDFYTLDDRTIVVCVETYFKLHEKNGGQSIQRITLVFTVVFMRLLYGYKGKRNQY